MKALLLAIALGVLVGCGPSARYCDQCGAGVTEDESGHTKFVRGKCTVEGKEVDCSKEHILCPQCRDK